MQDKLADAIVTIRKKDSMHHSMGRSSFLRTHQVPSDPQKDKHRLHQFGIEVLPDVFIGYTLHAGGGWTEDLLIVDWDELEKNVALEVHVKRLKSAELIRISCRWVLQTRRARSTSCLAIRTKANRDHRCGERTTHFRLRLQATSRMIRLTKMSSLKQNVTISSVSLGILCANIMSFLGMRCLYLKSLHSRFFSPLLMHWPDPDEF